MATTGLFKRETHYLDKMGFKELFPAFFSYYAIQVYILLVIAGYGAAYYYAESAVTIAVSMVFAIFIFAPSWYVTHRFILHGRWLYKIPFTAKFWKRVHYDHHQDPHNLEVLFGALHTTLPPLALINMPAGYLIGGTGGALAAFATGCLWTILNEFFHCIEHLNFKPKSKWLKHIKEQHMMHHFHNEDGNYGIINFGWDRLLGTYYLRKDRPVKSKTVFNLGYTEEEAKKYPWVAEASGGVDDRRPREKRATYKTTSHINKAETT